MSDRAEPVSGPSPASRPGTVDPMVILAVGALIVLLCFGLRASQGLFLVPITLDKGWTRETFALAMAIQNLCWGLFQPFAGAAAERYGTLPVLLLGGIAYAIGLAGMVWANDPVTFNITAGVLIGLGQSGWGLAIVVGAVSRSMPEDKRSFAVGLVTSAGAVGQLSVVPLGQLFLELYLWETSLLLLCAIAVAAIPLAWFLGGRAQDDSGPGAAPKQSLGAALREAAGHRGFLLLTAGFFVCGFHVSFVGVHLPAFLVDEGLPDETGAWALALIGGFNIIGCMLAGRLGARHSKKYLLSGLYALRGIVFLTFLLLPVTTFSVFLFSVVLGLLWLSTVPLTSGLIGQIFGVRYMSTLFGIVFLSHQIGSFLGVWLGGRLYDATGSYDTVWWIGVALGFASAIVHWPIDDRPVARVPVAAATA